MQSLEVSSAVGPMYGLLGVKRLSWCFLFFKLPLHIFPLLFSKPCFNKRIQPSSSRTVVVPCVAALLVSTLDTFVASIRNIWVQYLS